MLVDVAVYVCVVCSAFETTTVSDFATEKRFPTLVCVDLCRQDATAARRRQRRSASASSDSTRRRCLFTVSLTVSVGLYCAVVRDVLLRLAADELASAASTTNAQQSNSTADA